MKNKNINADLKNLAMDQPEVPEKDPTDAGRPSMGYDRDFDAYIEKAINRRIKKIAARTFIVMLAAVVAVIFCISPLMRLIFPDAVRMEKDGQQLLTLMRAYYETTMPWKEVISLEAESDGFGCYTLNMDVTDLRRQQYIGEVNVQMAMRLGKLSVKNDPDHRTAFETGKFYTEKMEEVTDPDAMIEELEKLPESAIIYISVSQKEASDVSTVMDRAGSMLWWLQVYEPENTFQAGVSTAMSASYGDRDIYRSQMTAAEIKQIYLENLGILRDNMDIWKDLNVCSNSTVYYQAPQVIDEAIAAAQADDSFMTVNYCLAGSKEKVLDYLRSADLAMLVVERVDAGGFGG